MTRIQSAYRLLLLAVVTLCLAAAAHSEPWRTAVKLAYDPVSRGLTVTLDELPDRDRGELQLPAWLSQVETSNIATSSMRSAVFSGVLPDIKAGIPSRGANDSGAFLLGALDWMATAEIVPTEISIQTPTPYRALATGDLLSESATEEYYTATYDVENDWPRIDIFAGPYGIEERVVSLPSGDVAVRTYFKKEEQKYSQDYLQAVDQYLFRFSDEIAPYPYQNFAVVSAPIPVGYAFDGVTYISDQILGHPYMLGRSLAHEVLHSWWGSGVRIDYETGNWAEGLTTYQADYALAEDSDPEAAKAMRREWLAALSSLPSDKERSLREFRSSSHDRDQTIGYGKSAMVFHMLKQSLGESVFAAGLRRFWNESYGDKAAWSDIQRAFETESDRDLAPFFKQWLDRTGLPHLLLDDAFFEKVDDGFAVSVTVSQKGDPFSIEIPILIETTSGTLQEIVQLDQRTSIFNFSVLDEPTSVSLDPNFETLRLLVEGELPLTIRDVLRAPEVSMVVAEGANEAAKKLTGHLFRDPQDIASIDANMALPAVDALIAVGRTDQIIELRAQYFASVAPAVATQGGVRAWVEMDAKDRLWLFSSSDELSTLAEALSTLRYYASGSFLMIEPDARPETGRWPVESHLLRFELNQVPG